MSTPETATERTAVVAAELGEGRELTTAEIMRIANLTRDGAYKLMYRISRVRPLVLDDGRWYFLRAVDAPSTGQS
jgi:hypothetical protein